MKARLAAAWSSIGLPLFLALALALVMGLAATRAKSDTSVATLDQAGGQTRAATILHLVR